MGTLIVGSVALDTIETPHGGVERALGGSASYAALAARLFTPTAILGVVGADFLDEHIRMFSEEGIDAGGLQVVPDGKTFHWHGRYHDDMNDRTTLLTEINVLGTHHPDVPEAQREPDFLFLANTDPELQLKTLSQVKRPRLVLADTMNLWINTKCDALWRLIAEVDVLLLNDSEAQQLCETSSLVAAGRRILDTGCSRVIIKKGEHGCLMMTGEEIFAAPAYPLERVWDPTGAGDCFAGAYLGHLAQADALDEAAHRRALIAGTAAASFNCEAFGVDRLRALTVDEVIDRCTALKRITHFEAVTAEV